MHDHAHDHEPHGHATHRQGTDGTRGEAAEWDELYRREGDDVPIWSGRPNGALVAEVADLPPGRALDVGCGEGADAIWLASLGWRVTAVDPSGVALARARAAGAAAGVEVDWVHAGLLEMPGGTGQHDLVSAQYPGLRRTPDAAAERALLAAVAPGGTLLVVHHLVTGDHRSQEHGFDPAEYVLPPDVAAALDATWTVEVDEVRPRPGDLPEDARHVEDVVLRARRSTRADPGDG